MTLTKIPVLIVDDQTILREGLAAILSYEEDIEVVGTAENGLVAVDIIHARQPRIVLLDVEMPEMNGMECLIRIKQHYPHIRVIMFTTFAYEDYIVDALIHGASGYLLKDIHHKKLISAIREADEGELLLPTPIAAKFAARLRAQQLSRHDDVELGNRERDIAKLLVLGRTNREIADSLHLSEGTVKNYITSIYSKIGTNDRGKAIVYLKDYIA